jgi:hypothetical protein
MAVDPTTFTCPLCVELVSGDDAVVVLPEPAVLVAAPPQLASVSMITRGKASKKNERS